MQGGVNKLFVFRNLSTATSNVLPLHLKQTFPPIFGISLKVKVIGYPGYLLKSFRLYLVMHYFWLQLFLRPSKILTVILKLFLGMEEVLIFHFFKLTFPRGWCDPRTMSIYLILKAFGPFGIGYNPNPNGLYFPILLRQDF